MSYVAPRRVTFCCNIAAGRQEMLRRGCGHDLCIKIRGTNPASRRGSTALAVMLVAPVNGAPALLLTKNYAEAEYGMTAGIRNLHATDGGCYLKAGARLLESDAKIPERFVRSRVDFLTFRRLRESNTPVLIGKLREQDMWACFGMSYTNDSCTTRLFRYDYSKYWRVVDTWHIRPVADGVRHVCAEVNLHVGGRP
jgi:hypothetical protein